MVISRADRLNYLISLHPPPLQETLTQDPGSVGGLLNGARGNSLHGIIIV